MTDGDERPRVLLVDDEPNLLNALARQIHGFVDAKLVSSSTEAVRLLERTANGEGREFSVIISDMRMPGLDGAALLKRARAVCPETTRMLLTGYADLESAIAAVNDGGIFRLLTKPCPTPTLRDALTDAIEQYDQVRARRELSNQTLSGAIEALVETLALAHPEVYARAYRLRGFARDVADRIGIADVWQVEVAAQLGEIGAVTLPTEALEALTRGAPADAAVAGMLESLPAIAESVLSRIPGMERVRDIVQAQQPVDDPDPEKLADASLSAKVVQAAREFDALTSAGHPPETALGILAHRTYHPPDILAALQAVAAVAEAAEVREVDVSYLRPGPVLAADVRSSSGVLLVSHGHALTDELLTRIRSFAELSGLEKRPMIVIRKH